MTRETTDRMTQGNAAEAQCKCRETTEGIAQTTQGNAGKRRKVTMHGNDAGKQCKEKGETTQGNDARKQIRKIKTHGNNAGQPKKTT